MATTCYTLYQKVASIRCRRPLCSLISQHLTSNMQRWRWGNGTRSYNPNPSVHVRYSWDSCRLQKRCFSGYPQSMKVLFVQFSRQLSSKVNFGRDACMQGCAQQKSWVSGIPQTPRGSPSNFSETLLSRRFLVFWTTSNKHKLLHAVLRFLQLTRGFPGQPTERCHPDFTSTIMIIGNSMVKFTWA